MKDFADIWTKNKRTNKGDHIILLTVMIQYWRNILDASSSSGLLHVMLAFPFISTQ